ncbi:MAG: aminopeptidase P family N-terminal domain-containing protein, partial [Rhodospirillales bacterium]|nr:aminopeptidase P family N-terminal domain-containing protein [Rhodospirillales bacterium]
MTFETDPPDTSSEATPNVGDLAAALKDAGVQADASEVLSRLRGVAATPDNFDRETQRSLIVPSGNDQLSAFLDAQTTELAQCYDRMIRPGDRETTKVRLATLRGELAARGLTGFLIPRFDEHLGEYVARHSQRLAWLTGFTGSAGTAVVLRDKAALFVDGRYTVQAPAETADDLYRPLNSSDTPPSKWLKQVLGADDRIGYDPWLHTPDAVKSLREAADHAGAELVPVETNPVDTVWTDRPPPPLGPVIVHPDAVSGETSSSKRTRIADQILKDGADAAILTAPDSIAWLLNIRGGDLPHTPVALGFAILHTNATVDLFMNRRKFADGVAEHLGNQVRARDPGELATVLDDLGKAKKTVRLDPAGSVAWFLDRLEAAGATLARAAD